MVPDSDPDAVIEQTAPVATLGGVTVHVPASAVEKPVPVIVIVEPAGPEFGVRVIVGPRTVN